MTMQPWDKMSNGRKAALIGRGVFQLALTGAALWDIHRRADDELNGNKWVWTAVSLVNFAGLGPLAYFLFGRRG
jgi:hypothetical protein